MGGGVTKRGEGKERKAEKSRTKVKRRR